MRTDDSLLWLPAGLIVVVIVLSVVTIAVALAALGS